MKFKRECAVPFCLRDRSKKVRFELKSEGFGYKTHWLCIDHAITQLESEARELAEEREADRKKRANV